MVLLGCGQEGILRRNAWRDVWQGGAPRKATHHGIPGHAYWRCAILVIGDSLAGSAIPWRRVTGEDIQGQERACDRDLASMIPVYFPGHQA